MGDEIRPNPNPNPNPNPHTQDEIRPNPNPNPKPPTQDEIQILAHGHLEEAAQQGHQIAAVTLYELTGRRTVFHCLSTTSAIKDRVDEWVMPMMMDRASRHAVYTRSAPDPTQFHALQNSISQHVQAQATPQAQQAAAGM